jgi:hypothetical protein
MDIQIQTDWVPNPKQAALLETAQEAGFGKSISAICEAAGVERTNFYYWMKNDPNFKELWNGIWRPTIKHHLPGIVQAQIAQALTGDTAAAKFCAELDGTYKPTGKIELSRGVDADTENQQHKLSLLTDEELKTYLELTSKMNSQNE